MQRCAPAPKMCIRDRLTEVLMLHKGLSKAEAFEESVKMLDAVKMPEARKQIGRAHV